MKRSYLYLALFLLFLTLFLSIVYYRQIKTQKDIALQPKSVVIANENIPPRTIIAPHMVSLQKRPAKDVLPDALITLNETIGQVSTQTISIDSQVLRSQVQTKGGTLGLPFVIPPGKRAVSIAVVGESALAGLLKPGDRVDILSTFDLGEDKTYSTIVLQNVLVLAMGTQLAGTKETGVQEKRTGEGMIITLALSPQDAEKLTLAAAKGNLKLIGRPIEEENIIKTTGATISTVLAGRLPTVKTKSIPMPITSVKEDTGRINMYRGTSVEEVVR